MIACMALFSQPGASGLSIDGSGHGARPIMATIQPRRGVILLLLIAVSASLFFSTLYRFRSHPGEVQLPAITADHGQVSLQILQGDAIAPKLGNETIKYAAE